ncbi:hypothetical protein TNCV_1910471 [Trichonephila clavipes]|nr:hypothetical protein TNCV_1910471 [Trichonephila clavipes]
MSDRGPRNSLGHRASCTPTVILSFEHHTDDSTFGLEFARILKENTLGVVRGLLPLFSFHQPHVRTCGSTAVYSTPRPKENYTFANIHAFS